MRPHRKRRTKNPTCRGSGTTVEAEAHRQQDHEVAEPPVHLQLGQEQADHNEVAAQEREEPQQRPPHRPALRPQHLVMPGRDFQKGSPINHGLRNS